ncbi:MAG: hypothetical protein ACI4BH_03310 [Muribaculaceae bacterium]
MWCTPRPQGKSASEMLIITRMPPPIRILQMLFCMGQQTTEGYTPGYAPQLRLGIASFISPSLPT